MLNKKAQVSETVTWIIATLVIIGILMVSLFISSVLGKAKNISVEFSDENKIVNWVEAKTSFAYFLASQEQKQIIEDFQEEHG